jgi:hypothetical protein
MSKHTKGPWNGIKESSGKVFVQSQDGKKFIAELSADETRNWCDAHLIAAAPDLVFFAKQVAEATKSSERFKPLYDEAMKLIAKAEGRS